MHAELGKSGPCPWNVMTRDWYNTFEWIKHRGASYRYFFVRGKHDPSRLFKGAACPPKVVVSADMWKVYENCPASVNAHPG